MTKQGINRRVSLDNFRMKVAYRNAIIFSAGVCLLLFLPAACTVPSSSGPVAITKVNPYHLKDANAEDTVDPMIRFEKDRHLRGAVDSADLEEIYGNYYTVFWKTDKPGVPATIRLDYRQARTGPQILTREIQVSSPKKKNATHLKIIGSDHKTNGAVTQWKASIIQNGAVITEYKSFLWQ